ncbi:MAG: phosphatase PAP2-related protein [bacterium]|nr:phosphatase PAP2-related protein [bacterium]
MPTPANHWLNKDYWLSIITGFIFLIFSLVINFYANLYAVERASNPVTDIILSNVPVFDLDGLFIYGAFGLVALIAYLGLSKPRRLPFILKSIALFVIIRSVFISLTHIGIYPTHATLDSNPLDFLLRRFALGNDLFFSGHTGLPFLMALLFWNKIYWRYIFLTLSLIFGVVVLLAHLHYSIDVLAAFFITYSIYHLARRFFPLELKLFQLE